MDSPTPILLVTGPPASGKTFVARLLADRLGLALIEKDAIKETLYDTMGTGDGAWEQRLGRATYAMIHWAVEVHLKARRPVIVEANFAADVARPAFQALAERHPLKALEFHCTAPEEVLLARYAERAGSRHPGHRDTRRMPDVAAAISDGRYGALALGSEGVIVIDTTSFDDLDADALVEAARAQLIGGPVRGAGRAARAEPASGIEPETF